MIPHQLLTNAHVKCVPRGSTFTTAAQIIIGGFRGYVHFGQLCTSTKYCAPYVAMPKVRVEVGVMHGHIASVTLMHVNEFTFSHRPGINIFLFITLNHNLSVT